MTKPSVVCLALLILVTVSNCVANSPAVIETPSLSAFVGTCVEIKCKVTGDLPDEDALWFWMKDGTWDSSRRDFNGTIVYSNKPEQRSISAEFRDRATYTGSTRFSNRASSSRNPSCSVSICDLREQDSGKYFFRYIPNDPSNKWKTEQDVSLTVTVNPCELTFNPTTVQEGSTITMFCSRLPSCSSNLEIESVPPSGMKTKHFINTAMADFPASKDDNNREFTCQTRGNTDPQLVKKMRLSVWYKPRNTDLLMVNQTTDVVVGQSVIFACRTDTNPPTLTYEWFQDNLSRPRTKDNRLKLKNVQRGDEGCYMCRATNMVGIGDFSKILCIKVHYPPTDMVLSMDTDLTEGDRIYITCQVQSFPVASLTLSRTSQDSTEELEKTIGRNYLRFTVIVTSAHSGRYTCSAQNSVGSNSTQKSLRVQYGPKEVRVQADPGLTVKENMTLRLRCSAQSDPPVSFFSWSRGPAGQERHVHTGTNYTVESVSVNDTGLYSCTAHHPIRNQTSPPAQVQVQFGPKQVVVLRAEEEQGPDGSRSVTLSCSSHSFPLSLYTWYRSTEGGATKVSENISITVPSTQPGLYYCTAENEVSQSTSEPVSLFQQQSQHENKDSVHQQQK